MQADAEIARIAAMSARERREAWQRRFGTAAPPAFGAGLIARVLAHAVQERSMGKLARRDLRRIAQLQEGSRPDSPSLRPGTWLSRTWHGEVHQVIVLESGFDYRGRHYASLSMIAREITGAHWSGPRFFGLKSPRIGSLEVARS